MAVVFFNEDVSFSLKNKNAIKGVIKATCLRYGKQLGDVNVVFCSDEFLLEVNRKHLNHDYYTDIITFNGNEGNVISGDLFISIERVTDNAMQMKSDAKEEVLRVIFHGILHLVGENDKTKKETLSMREAESACLKELYSLISTK